MSKKTIKPNKKDNEIEESTENHNIFLEKKSKKITTNTLDFNKTSSLISINNSIDIEDKLFKQDAPSLEIRISEFSESRLLQAWEDLIYFIKKQGKSNLGITLGVHKPIILDEYLIELPLSNSAQQEIFLEDKLIVLRYLRDKLDNDKLEIKTSITEIDSTKNPYTNKDKYNLLREKNPLIEELKNAFKLSI